MPLVHAKVDPNSQIAKDVREMVRSSTPRPDYTLYLTPSDIRDPSDVRRWLEGQLAYTHAFFHDRYPELGSELRPFGDTAVATLASTVTALVTQLDRERRQAYRRGALKQWRLFTAAVQDYERRRRFEGLICDTDAEDCIEQYLSEAIALRDAARGP
jgi:hypothetical protein